LLTVIALGCDFDPFGEGGEDEASPEDSPGSEPRVDATVNTDLDTQFDVLRGVFGDASTDARRDVGRVDATRRDVGRVDATRLDAGRLDAARLDAGRLDAGRLDAGRLDAGRLDAAPMDRPPVERPAVEPGSPRGGPPDWQPSIESGAVWFPYRPYRCPYQVRRVSPAVTRAQFHDDRAGAAPRPRNLHLTFAGDPSTSVVVQWSTDSDTLSTEVRFGERESALDHTAKGFSFWYPGAPWRRQHEVHICGLEPGHTYHYDVGGRGPGARSARYHFVTAPSGPAEVTAIVAGDSRTNLTVWSNVARRAMTEGADLLILSGDAVARGTHQSEWDELFEASPELWATLPTVWTHGNHEGLAEPYFAQLALPDHGGPRGVEQWYALTYGPLRIVALNDTVATTSDITVAQAAFLRESLGRIDRARTPYVVTVHHQPMYTTSSAHSSNVEIRGAWAPLFDLLHVNLDIAGHVHSYESTRPLRGGDGDSVGQVVGPEAGTRYLTYGGGGAPLYEFGRRAPWIITRSSTHGYGVLTASPTRLTWTARRTDGSVLETLDLLH
jgi:hypothetical protein